MALARLYYARKRPQNGYGWTFQKCQNETSADHALTIEPFPGAA
jgi:hypothetical protein